MKRLFCKFVKAITFNKICLGYCGSKDIFEFRQKAQFIQITSSGIIESHPHDINMTKDSPNYRKVNFKQDLFFI